MSYHLIVWIEPDFVKAFDLGYSVKTLIEKEEEERKMTKDYLFINHEYITDYKYRKMKQGHLLQ